MSQIHILDKYNFEVKDVLTNKQNQKVVLEDKHTRNIENHTETYDFTVDYRASSNLENRDRVLIPDEVKGHYREFIINSIETDTFDGETEVLSEASYLEDLNKAKAIEPQTLEQATPNTALTFALRGTGWEVGEVEYSGFRTISWTSYNTPFELLKVFANRFEGNLDFTIETKGNKVTRRLVHLRQTNVLFNGKEIRRGKDLVDLKRVTQSTDVVTALIALAPEPQVEGQERLVIEVKDDEAQALWGKTYNYIWGIYEPESSDENMTEERLRTLAKTELNKHNKPKVDYTIEAASIEQQYPHEKVVIGDRARIKDDLSEPYFYVDATVKEVSRSIFDKHSKTYVLGEIIEYQRDDLRKHFNAMLSVIRDRLKNTNSNLDNIVNIIDTEVERRIFKQDTPPDNPYNGQLWLDTSNRDKPILKEYFNGEWIERIKNITEPEDIGAISREEAMFETILSAYENIKVAHEQLLSEALIIKENKYVNQTNIDNIDSKLQAVLLAYNAITEAIELNKGNSHISLEEANRVHLLMLEYSSAVAGLREAIANATDFAMAHLAYLQSQYTEEKYNEAMTEVANKFGLIYEDGILLGNTVLMKDLQDTRDELQQQLTDSTNTLNDMIDSITGDNRNYIIGTSLMDDSQFNLHGGSVIPDSETIEYVHFDSNGISDNLPHIKFHNTNTYNAGDTYTLALDFRSDTVTELDYICLCTDTEHNILHTDMQPQPFNLTSDGQWHRHFMQFTPETDLVNAYVKIGTDFSNSTDGEFDIRRIHIYKGTSELTWQPAPEDNRQFITQLSREITDMEHKLASKLTREDYDVLAGDISSLNTEIIQTAESITQKADKSYVDTVNETVTNHSTQLTTHAEGIDTLIAKTELHDESLSTVTNKVTETAEGLEQTITKVTEAENAIEQAKADIVTNTEEISSKLSTAKYSSDHEDVVTRLEAADSERVQLSNLISDRVTLTDYESYKTQTGTLGDANRSLHINHELKGKWLRLAINRGDRAHARFIIADKTSSQHGTVDFTAGVLYNKADNAEFVVNNFSKYTSFPFTKARFLTKDTYDEQYLDVYFDPSRNSINNVDVWIKDNIQTSGWVLQRLEEAVVPSGYQAVEYEINEKASTKGVLKTHETLIQQNGKDILLRATTEELDSVDKTLSESHAQLKLNTEQIQGEVTGLSDDLTEVSTLATQTKESFDISVIENSTAFENVDSKLAKKVGSDEVVTSINASREGVKINGNLIELTAGSAIKLAVDSAVKKGEVISQINLDKSGVKIKGDLIELTAGSAIKLAIDGAENRAKGVANSKVAPNEVISAINLDKSGATIDGKRVSVSAGSAIKLAIDAAESNANTHTNNVVNDLEIGGANLIPKTDFEEYINPPAGWTTWGSGAYINNRIQLTDFILVQNDTLTSQLGLISDTLIENIVEGQTYTLSFRASPSARIQNAMNYCYLINPNGDNQKFPLPKRKFIESRPNNAIYEYTTTIVANFSGSSKVMVAGYTDTTGAYGYIYMSKPQLEIGNKATSWSKSHRDTVSKDRIISEINLDKSGTKISGDMVNINANRINLSANEDFKLVVGDAKKALTDAKTAQTTASAAVPKTGVVSAINATKETVKISADKLALIGGKSISIRLNDADKAASNAQSTANTANNKANSVGDELSNLDAAGTNMLQHTNFSDLRNINKMGAPWGTGASYSRSNEYILVTTSSSGSHLGMRTMKDELYFEPNTQYTLSFKAYSSGYTTGNFNYVYIYRPDGSNEGSFHTKRIKLGDAPQAGYTLYEYRVTFTSTKDHDKPAQMLIADTTTRTGASTWVRIKDVMLQKGNLATPYALHPTEVVEKRNIIPEINLNDQGAKIQGDKIKLVAGDEISLEIADTQKKIIGAHVPNRNLIQNGDLWNSTSRFKNTHTSTATDIFATVDNPPIGKGWVRMQRSDGNLSYMWTHNGGRNRFTVTAGKTYTFSVLVTQNYHGNDLNYIFIRRVADSRQIRVTDHLVSKTLIGEQWGRPVYRYVYTFDVPWTSNNDTVMFMGMNNTSENSRGYYLSEWKLEEGTEATAYTEAYATKEDLMTQINLDNSGVKIQGNQVDITGSQINISNSSNTKVSTELSNIKNPKNIVDSINLASTNIRINGDHINLTGNATFSTTQTRANNGNAAYNRTEAYGNGTGQIHPNTMSNYGMTTISGGKIQTDQMTAKRINIETSSGRKVVVDGYLNRSQTMTARLPRFQSSEVSEDGDWYRTSSTSYVTANEEYYVHTARYLAVAVAVNRWGHAAYVDARMSTRSGRTSNYVSSGSESGSIYGWMRIDLGEPLSSPTSGSVIYQFKSRNSNETKRMHLGNRFLTDFPDNL